MVEVVDVLVRSLGSAGIYIFIALGYNVVYATSKVFNLAQGELAVTGMFVGVLTITVFGLPVPIAFFVAVAAVVLTALVIERVAVRPVTSTIRTTSHSKHGQMTWAVTTLAVALILQSLAEVLAGRDPYRFPNQFGDISWAIGGSVLSADVLLLFVCSLAMGYVLHLFYTRTRSGRTLDAMAEDTEAAAMKGVDTKRMTQLAWILCGITAGVAAFLIAPITYVYPTVGALYTFKGFVAIAIGGMGNNAGAVLGGLTLAIMETVGVTIFGSPYRDVVAMVFLLVVLLIRPQGILGARTERRV